MSEQPFISYAQNGEDVVLWRALGHVHGGVYVDVGGWDPDVDSVTRAFYDRGWRGIDIEPVPELAERFRERRPRNEVVQAVVTQSTQDAVVLHQFGGTGLSTLSEELAERHDDAGFEREDIRVPARRLDDVLADSGLVADVIHFLKVDVEGAEEQVLRSIDLHRWRPWVLVIEATEPNSTTTTHHTWEPIVLDAGYTFTLFDGLSRFYVSEEHPELLVDLGYPACALDNFRPAGEVELTETIEALGLAAAAGRAELDEARSQAVRWRNEAVTYWVNAVARAQASEDAATAARNESERLHRQVKQVRATLQRVRGERRQLRARVSRMSSRIERMSTRIEALQGELRAAGPARGRLGSMLRKATGA